MIINIVQFLVGSILLYYGAELLISGSRILAKIFNISPVLVGITLVALGTSLPELIVSLIAIMKGDSGFVIGNVIGSNIANIGLVLSITAIIVPIYLSYRNIKYDLIFLFFITLLPLIFIYFGKLGFIHGLSFISLLIFYCWYLYKQNSIIDGEEYNEVEETYLPVSIKIIAGIIGLGFGANIFVMGAKGIAIILGVPSIVIGMSIVAIGTSLPELATSLTAAKYNQTELIIGNIIGSNIINIVAVLGITVIYMPITIKYSEINNQGMIMIILTILLPLLLKFKGGISRFSASILLIIYILFLFLNFGIDSMLL